MIIKQKFNYQQEDVPALDKVKHTIRSHRVTSTKGTIDPEGARLHTYSTIGLQ